MVGIGPYPLETLEFARSIPNLECIMGNHDHWYAYGLPDPTPAWMSQDEIDHQNWTHTQLGDSHKAWVQSWPFSLNIEGPAGHTINFRHYALTKDQNWFQPISKEASAEELDQMFADVEADIIFYGHNHIDSDIIGNSRYVDLGSTGCYDRPWIRIAVLDLSGEEPFIQKITSVYEDEGLLQAYDERQVPARDFIRKVFVSREED